MIKYELMKPQTIRSKLGLLLLSFFALVALSAVITYWASDEQRADALVINLAGRQRMLTQQMTWLALNAPTSEELTVAINQFDITLQALREGGVVLDADSRPVTLPPSPDPLLDAQFAVVNETWSSFREKLRIIRSTPTDEPAWAETAAALQAESPLILAQLDNIVMGFEKRAEVKVARLLWFEIGFMLLAFALLIVEYQLARRWILKPLSKLENATTRISLGEFKSPIKKSGEDEFGKLAEIFEIMRGELAVARELLEDRVARRTRELSAAFEFSQEIVAQLNLEHLLQSVVERTQDLMQADSVALCLLNSDQTTLELAAARGNTTFAGGMKHSLKQGLAVKVIDSGQVQTSENTCSGCGFLHSQGQGLCLAAPLKVGTQYLGALCLSRKGDQEFDEDEKKALTLLVNAAAIAITNSNLAASQRQEAQQVAVLAEREHLAAELHDHLAQTLSFMRIKTERLEGAISGNQTSEAYDELRRIQSALEMAYTQVRDALSGLRQPPPAGGDFAQKLAECKAEFERLTDLPLLLHIQHPEALELPASVQVQVIHIIKGGLSNIHRHAHAKHVKICAEQENGSARFIIEDDGIGFTPNDVLDENHLGLRIMRARTERSGGQFTLDSIPGKGTRVVVSFPTKR